MKSRECPYCHKKVSLRKCIKYIIKGTKYSTIVTIVGNNYGWKRNRYLLCIVFLQVFYNVLVYAIFSLLL